MTLEISVDRSGLDEELDPLVAVDYGRTGATIDPDSWQVGGVRRDRRWAESDHSDGGTLLTARALIETIVGRITFWGAAHDEVTAFDDALAQYAEWVDALSQFTFEITETLGEQETVFTCYAADIVRVLDAGEVQNGMVGMSFQIPRDPLT